jgi:hypothetical protein
VIAEPSVDERSGDVVVPSGVVDLTVEVDETVNETVGLVVEDLLGVVLVLDE